MAIDLDSGAGLFDRLGALGHVVNVLNAFRGGGSAGDLPVEINDFLALYDGAGNEVRGTVLNVLPGLETFQLSGDALLTTLRTAAENILIEMVDADNPLPSRTVEFALQELVAQMIDGSETVKASEPTLTITAGGGNAGDGVLLGSLLDGEGRLLENCLAEDIVGTITDAGTPGSETLTVLGEEDRTSDKLSWRFPSGSGTSITLTARDPASSGFLSGGGFETFEGTANVPDGWTLAVGTAGTHCKQDLSTPYRGVSALQLLGDGSTLVALTQSLDPTSLEARVNYPLLVRVKGTASTSAGVLQIDLYDGSAVVEDDAGTANSLVIDLTTLTTGYVAYQAVFRLPAQLPTTLLLRIRMTTALENAKSIYLDDLCLGEALEPTVDAGPTLALFIGAENFGLDDSFAVSVANSRGGKFQELFDRLFQLPTLMLPSATGAAETIDDGLIA